VQSSTLLSRQDFPAESTWDSASVYAGWAAWEADYQAAQAELPLLSQFEGRFHEGPGLILAWLEEYSRQYRRLMKLFQFARMSNAVDTSDTDAKKSFGQINSLNARFLAAASFAIPELLDQGDQLLAWAAAHPGLALYHHYFENILRQRPHRRSAEVESLLGSLADPFTAVSQTARELTNSDLKFAPAVDSAGAAHPVHQATIPPTGIESPDRTHRKNAWENFADGYRSVENTLASNYLAAVKQFVFLARARNYSSVLEMRLASANLPVSVFHNLIGVFKQHLPVWHRYWDVKRRILGLDALHPYDVWAPVVHNPPHVPYRQAVDWISAALEPLGSEYVAVLRRGCLQERWVDYAPNSTKMQGAASSLRFDTPPFIYMTYNDTPTAMSVLAHELGHSMHSYLMAEHQPVVYTNFDVLSSTVTETASNFHQALLRNYLHAEKAADLEFQIALIDEALFNFHRYFFTMPTLACFEYEVFSRAEQNLPLSAAILNQLARDLFAEGYGDTMADDPPRTALAWAQYLHLYFPFYTFQYAVGISAAHALAGRVLELGAVGAEDYLKFLAAGGSLYPMDLFTMGGVDMASPAPVEKAFSVLADLVDRLEACIT
jgi:oligoendopeptidase F